MYLKNVLLCSTSRGSIEKNERHLERDPSQLLAKQLYQIVALPI